MIDWRTSKLIDRIGWAKANLKPVRTDYCVVYEDIDMNCASVMHPDPHCMAMLMHGGLMPPVEVWHKLHEDEARPDFTQHSDFRGHLLHDTEPMGPLTEEEAVEFLIRHTSPHLENLGQRQQAQDGGLPQESATSYSRVAQRLAYFR